MVAMRVLEARAERRESSSLSIRTKGQIWELHLIEIKLKN